MYSLCGMSWEGGLTRRLGWSLGRGPALLGTRDRVAETAVNSLFTFERETGNALPIQKYIQLFKNSPNFKSRWAPGPCSLAPATLKPPAPSASPRLLFLVDAGLSLGLCMQFPLPPGLFITSCPHLAESPSSLAHTSVFQRVAFSDAPPAWAGSWTIVQSSYTLASLLGL